MRIPRTSGHTALVLCDWLTSLSRVLQVHPRRSPSVVLVQAERGCVPATPQCANPAPAGRPSATGRETAAQMHFLGTDPHAELLGQPLTPRWTF